MVNSTSRLEGAVTPITEKVAVTDRTMEGERVPGGSTEIVPVAASGGGGGPPLLPPGAGAFAQCDPATQSTASSRLRILIAAPLVRRLPTARLRPAWTESSARLAALAARKLRTREPRGRRFPRRSGDRRSAPRFGPRWD